ncbi:hypothetical protein AB0J51_03745 [Micromonospora echinofusca]|uniref:hypothetical protein n=1 Tax=Micromonospora echinofusca TaxID=47858 RepID=UPI003426E05E
MDPSQWAELAQAGAAALVAAMATEAWTVVRGTAARLVGGSDERDAVALEWLEKRRQDLATLPGRDRDAATDALREQVAGVLLTRLTDDPDRASLVERVVSAANAPTQPVTVTQHASATLGGRVYQAGRDATFVDR